MKRMPSSRLLQEITARIMQNSAGDDKKHVRNDFSFEGLPHCVLSVRSVRNLSAKSNSQIEDGFLDEVF